ncbi:SRPBCC family protein [Saccharothrix algeriensis]|uniref:SRPBCC family protein n=1 Tax=Saccharothrix algeriensis TaxID=173560 RepID=A0A8T8I009_9PSEU|nr:SRPBCC family protein [Saccharothrix algeriensis]MBM7815071.1 hypothetical protein [Saccharothrix algeriensis]QTR03324.1 SRPBCC family protein [Saccharothrix algeriensis]
MTAAHGTSTCARAMPAGAEVVFDIVTDLDNLSSWLPPGVEVERYGPDLLRLWTHRDEVVERRIAIDWEHLRVTWASEATPTYAGRLRVLRIAPHRSAVDLRLTGPEGLPRHRLDEWADRALTALAALAGAEPRDVAWPATVH